MQLLKLTIVLIMIALAASYEHHEEPHHHPKYHFDYGVKDVKSGDHHSHWESRDGDMVKGQYTLDETDGTKRVVKYHSDKHGGFKAHVERIGHAIHPYKHHKGDDKHDHGHATSYQNVNLYYPHEHDEKPGPN